MQHGKHAHVYDPQFLALPSIHYLHVGSSQTIASPSAIGPAVLAVVESFHPGLVIFLAVLIQYSNDIIFALYKFFPNHDLKYLYRKNLCMKIKTNK